MKIETRLNGANWDTRGINTHAGDIVELFVEDKLVYKGKTKEDLEMELIPLEV